MNGFLHLDYLGGFFILKYSISHIPVVILAKWMNQHWIVNQIWLLVSSNSLSICPSKTISRSYDLLPKRWIVPPNILSLIHHFIVVLFKSKQVVNYLLLEYYWCCSVIVMWSQDGFASYVFLEHMILLLPSKSLELWTEMDRWYCVSALLKNTDTPRSSSHIMLWCHGLLLIFSKHLLAIFYLLSSVNFK